MLNLGTVMLNLGTIYRHVWPSLIVLLVTSIMAFFTSKFFIAPIMKYFLRLPLLKMFHPWERFEKHSTGYSLGFSQLQKSKHLSCLPVSNLVSVTSKRIIAFKIN